MTLEPKRGITYGPLRSLRLGSSLGVNLLPPGRKLCRFDCVYCQYGRTASSSPAGLERELPTVDQVVAAVEAALDHLPEAPAWLTFSGNGEPTLHPDFPAMVDALIALRDRRCPAARTAILSSSTEVCRPEVRRALARLDARIMKLDVGSQAMLETYNRPSSGVVLEAIQSGLAELADLTLQTLLAGGETGNFTAQALKAWFDRVIALRPARVQLYSLSRPHAAAALDPLLRCELVAVANVLRREGVAVEVF